MYSKDNDTVYKLFGHIMFYYEDIHNVFLAWQFILIGANS